MSDLDKTTYLPSEMAEEIRGIKRSLSGMQEIHGIDSSEHGVHFYDYDGSLLYSYSPNAFLLMDEMPPNPAHEGLIAQGWNWSLEDAKQYVAKHGALSVGQMYTTYDGKTRIYVRIDESIMYDRKARNKYYSQLGNTSYYNGMPYVHGMFQPDQDFYDFYLDLSFSYEDDGFERSWPETQPCAIIDWGDGTTEKAWLDGNHGTSELGSDIEYNEPTFRYIHRFGYDGHEAYHDYVITIEPLHNFWRGRLGFSLNSFEEKTYDYHYMSMRANSSQFIRKIELGDHMDLADHPDILRPDNYYLLGISTDYEPKAIVFNEFSFSYGATLLFPSDMLHSDGDGYLYVQLCLVKRDEETEEYIPFDFNVEQMLIEPNTAYSKDYSVESLLADWSDASTAIGFDVWTGVDYVATVSFMGHVTESKAYRHFSGNCYAFTNRLFEVTGNLPSTVEIAIEYPLEGQMACAVRWIPKTAVPYTQDNYLYNLESITLPKGVKSLGSVCFKNCYSLRHATVPDGITEIPCGVFANDSSLTSLSLPNSTQALGIQALHGCRKLSDVSFPDTILSIGAGCFDGCDSLSKIANVECIEQWVNYQDKEETAVVPEDIFSGCTDITEISIPETTTKISARAFKNCSSLQTVNVPLSVGEIGEEAFCGCASLIGGEGAFFAKESNSQVGYNRIGSFLRSIGKSAFKGCRLLTVILFPDRIQTIPDSVCEDCQSLLTATISVSARSIGNRAFYDCKSLTNVTFQSNGVYEIGDYAFSGCRFATFSTAGGSNEVLPDFLEKIGKRAFEKTSIRSITIPYAITELNEGTFAGCKLLETVEFIRDETLSSLSNENIYDIKKIGPYVFYDTMLTTISIPDSVTEIGAYAFAECWRLESVTLPSNLSEIADHVFESTIIKSIQLPNGITRIGDYAFSGCWRLETINIPGAVADIGEGCFMNAGHLASITLPASVRSIGDYAFAVYSDAYPGGSHLENITFLSRVPPTVEGTNAWQGLRTSCVIHVPMYRLDVYKSATNYPDPNVYTYVADQPDQHDNEVSISGSELIITGPSVNMLDDSLNFTDNFASLNNDELILSS